MGGPAWGEGVGAVEAACAVVDVVGGLDVAGAAGGGIIG